jgi:hypothetical protein
VGMGNRRMKTGDRIGGGDEVKCVEWLEEHVPPMFMDSFRQVAEAMQKMDSFQGQEILRPSGRRATKGSMF